LAANGNTAGRNITAAALWCAAVGVLVHGTIDFAIFEPGVWTTFWVVVACLIAINLRQKSPSQFLLTLPPSTVIPVVAGGIAVIWLCTNYTLIPVAKSTAKIEHAQQAGLQGQFEQAHSLLVAAAKDDHLSPAALYLNGQLYLQQYCDSASKQPHLLLRSESCFADATNRNRADFKNFERLSDVYTLLAEAPAQPKLEWLHRAYDSAALAIGRYPGSSRLHFKLAKIAEHLDKTNVAIEHYKKAVKIEEDHRRQFQLMYPGREIFSRLGEEKYQSAKQQIKQLGEKIAP
jgi:tetratricopeptide (TPR) repeat protein